MRLGCLRPFCTMLHLTWDEPLLIWCWHRVWTMPSSHSHIPLWLRTTMWSHPQCEASLFFTLMSNFSQGHCLPWGYPFLGSSYSYFVSFLGSLGNTGKPTISTDSWSLKSGDWAYYSFHLPTLPLLFLIILTSSPLPKASQAPRILLSGYIYGHILMDLTNVHWIPTVCYLLERRNPSVFQN